jgi:hypothetical protein
MELKLSEGRVYGSRYYTVEPTISWDPTNDWGSINAWEQMEKWCTSTFGPTGEMWGNKVPVLHRWYMNGAKFWFREQKDLEWFILKWQ